MFDPELYLVDELRKKLPGTGRKADHSQKKEGLKAGIKLFCLDCQGGDLFEVEFCKVYRCPLWPFRPYGKKVRPPDSVPTEEQYDSWTPDRSS